MGKSNENQQTTNTPAPFGDGGPAFPCAYPCTQGGMSLRDYFAAKAMAAMVAREDLRIIFDASGGPMMNAINPSHMGAIPKSYANTAAKLAYEIADAMLAARKAVRQ